MAIIGRYTLTGFWAYFTVFQTLLSYCRPNLKVAHAVVSLSSGSTIKPRTEGSPGVIIV